MLIGHFVAPIIILLMFINPAIKTVVVPDYLSDDAFNVIKYASVVVAAVLRIGTFRKELQFVCDESFQLMHSIVQTKNEKVFTYVRYRVQDNFKRTWYNVFQQATTVMLPICLVLLAVVKGQAWRLSDERVKTLEFEALPPGQR